MMNAAFYIALFIGFMMVWHVIFAAIPHYSATANLVQDPAGNHYQYNLLHELVYFKGQGRQSAYTYFANGLLAHATDYGYYNRYQQRVNAYDKTQWWAQWYVRGAVLNHTHHGSAVLLNDERQDQVLSISAMSLHAHVYNSYGQDMLHEQHPSYAGYDYNHASGLYDDTARFYDPMLGVFLSRDTVSSKNRYAYGSDNPQTYVDPTGHFSTFGLVELIGGLTEMGAAVAMGKNAMSIGGMIIALNGVNHLKNNFQYGKNAQADGAALIGDMETLTVGLAYGLDLAVIPKIMSVGDELGYRFANALTAEDAGLSEAEIRQTWKAKIMRSVVKGAGLFVWGNIDNFFYQPYENIIQPIMTCSHSGKACRQYWRNYFLYSSMPWAAGLAVIETGILSHILEEDHAMGRGMRNNRFNRFLGMDIDTEASVFEDGQMGAYHNPVNQVGFGVGLPWGLEGAEAYNRNAFRLHAFWNRGIYFTRALGGMFITWGLNHRINKPD